MLRYVDAEDDGEAMLLTLSAVAAWAPSAWLSRKGEGGGKEWEE